MRSLVFLAPARSGDTLLVVEWFANVVKNDLPAQKDFSLLDEKTV